MLVETTLGWPAVPVGSVRFQPDRLKLPDGAKDGFSVDVEPEEVELDGAALDELLVEVLLAGATLVDVLLAGVWLAAVALGTATLAEVADEWLTVSA